LIAALQLQSPPRVQSTAMRTRAMLVSGVGLIAVCAILFSWFQGGKDLSSDNPRTGKAASTNASAGISADGFVPSKSLWIRRDASEYDSLTDAIDSAEDGDVIEIGTDLECEPITIRDKKLTLRGAGNVRPVIRSANQKSISENSDAYFIRTEADLTLEGIEINWVASVQIPFFDERKLNAVVGAAPGTRLVIDRCKIVRSAGGICLATGGHLEMRRTTIEGANVALAWFGHHSQALVEDSVLESRVGIAVIYPLANAAVYTRSNLKLRHCTIRAVDAISAMLSRRPDEPVSIQMQDTIFDAGHAVSLMSISMTVRDHIESQPIAALKSCIEINESRCVYDNKCDFLISRRVKLIERVNRTRVSNLDQWLALPSNSDSAEGTQSIVAKIIRISRESGAPNQNQYRFESSSVDPLPIWIDQIGPTSTSPATP